MILKMFDPGIQKLWPKKIFFWPFFPIFVKLTRIIGVCEDNFFSKIDFHRFFTTTKLARSEIGQNSILEKKLT